MESVFIRQALATADFSEDEWLLFQSDTRNLRRCFRGFLGGDGKTEDAIGQTLIARKNASLFPSKEILP